jgi:hypothetical protein
MNSRASTIRMPLQVALGTTATVAALLGGPAGCVYFIALAVASTVGWPIGIALFGSHPVAVITGSVAGYGLTALALWTGTTARVLLVGGFVWIAMAVCGWLTVRRRDGPLVPLPEWAPSTTWSLAAALVLTGILVVPPFARVGARDPDGTRLYRAYFTADFIWHMGLTAELEKGDIPPRNPYLRGERLHYYWTYFLPPATAVRVAPRFPVADALKVTALFASLLFVASIFALVWTAVPRGPLVFIALAFGLLCASFEGTYALYDLWQRGRALSGVADLNIDAMSAWRFGGLRIDGLARAMWYNPQHSMSLALALPALGTVSAGGAAISATASLFVGVCLALSMTFNPFVGVLIAATYGGAVVVDAWRSRLGIRQVVVHAIAPAPMVLAFGWSIANQVAEGAGGAIRFGLGGPAANHPLQSMVLSLGPLLCAAAAGLLALRGAGASRLVPAALGSVIATVAMFGMRLSVDEFWVGFRTGHILQVLMIVLAAAGLARARGWWLAGVLAGLALVGVPTTLIDYRNAQDTGNRRMGPGFHWTVLISPDEQAGLEWIRTRTPPTAIVQMDPLVRGRETWSLIPSFAERRMAAGLPISLLNTPEYRDRSSQVREMYATADAQAGWQLARRLGIEYVYVDRVERAAYPGGMAKFDAAPSLFRSAFRSGEVGVWRVVPPGSSPPDDTTSR